MTQQSIIDLIVKDGRYKSICKKIVGTKKHLADDLYQELMLSVLECEDERFNNANKDNRLEVYLYGVATFLWSRNNQVKNYGEHGTSVFFEHDLSIENLNIQIADNSYNFDRDELENKLINIIKKDCDSQEMCIRYKARVFNLSHNDIAKIDNIEGCKNPRQFAESSQIPYSAVWKVCNEYKKTLKQRLK